MFVCSFFLYLYLCAILHGVCSCAPLLLLTFGCRFLVPPICIFQQLTSCRVIYLWNKCFDNQSDNLMLKTFFLFFELFTFAPLLPQFKDFHYVGRYHLPLMVF